MKIEIWSDIVCPWCYIGKRRLESALAEFDEDVELEWKSFELDRSAPKKADGPLDEALAKKYGMSLEKARQMMAQMTDTAAQEGLEFDFASAQGGNTFDAHRLLHLAKAKGLQAELKERLMSAYMVEGRPISEPDELVELAAEVGLDADEARRVLDGGAFEDAVRRDEAEARQVGVRGVPFFLIDEEIGIPGAQPAETLLDVLQRVRAKSANSTPAAEGTGDACDDGSCEVG
ncbi:MAG: DsbA family protein [Persicimonas sp.]